VSAPYKNGLDWVGLGIDLLLGAVSDQKPNLNQEAFLPILLFNKIALNHRFVSATNHLKYNNKPIEKGISPIIILLLVFGLYVFISSWNNSISQRIARVFDVCFLLVFGIGGVLVFYMSQISLHNACHENYNLIWLHPLYLLAIPIYFISKKWTSYIGYTFFIATILLMLASHWLPQHFSTSVMILMALALFVQIRLIQSGKLVKYK
jgi:hypothetical protein